MQWYKGPLNLFFECLLPIVLFSVKTISHYIGKVLAQAPGGQSITDSVSLYFFLSGNVFTEQCVYNDHHGENQAISYHTLSMVLLGGSRTPLPAMELQTMTALPQCFTFLSYLFFIYWRFIWSKRNPLRPFSEQDFRYCSSAVDRFFQSCHFGFLSPVCPVSSDFVRTHCTPCQYVKVSAKYPFRSHLVGVKILFICQAVLFKET